MAAVLCAGVVLLAVSGARAAIPAAHPLQSSVRTTSDCCDCDCRIGHCGTEVLAEAIRVRATAPTFGAHTEYAPGEPSTTTCATRREGHRIFHAYPPRRLLRQVGHARALTSEPAA